MESCPTCGTPYGKRRRCYTCHGRPRTGSIKECQVCGVEMYVSGWQPSHGEGKYCSTACKKKAQEGKTPHGSQGVGHRYVRKDGYVAIKTKPGRAYDLEHRVMMSLLLGRPLRRDEDIHHEDEEKSHNCPGNLKVLSGEEHQRLHDHPQNRSRKVPVTCALDGCEIVILRKISRSDGDRYCSNEHRLDAMHAKARQYHTERRERLGYGSDPLTYISYGDSWPAAREACRERDGRTCQHCGLHEDMLGEHVQAAHIIPFRSFPLGLHEVANRLENLISLCRSCHMKHDSANGLH